MIVLEAVRVWNWRGLDALALEDLAPDLNLVVGPNESGKSRLFEALRHALFERYKGQGYGRASLQGWATDEAPEVEVVFRAGGHRYTVRKRFLRREFARLEGAGQTWRDDDAETRLREILGTRDHDRVLRPEHLGIWPVLWLAQGRSGLPPHEDLHADGRARIHDALAAEVDEVAAGPRGQQVVERVAAEHARYWQPRAGLATGELKAARDAMAQADEALAAAARRRDAAHALADALTEATARQALVTPRLDARRGAASEAARREKAARDAAAAIEIAVARVGERRALADRAEADLAERAALERERTRLGVEIAVTEADAVRLDEQRRDTQAEFEAALREAGRAEAAEEHAAAHLADAIRQERRRETTRVAGRKREAFEMADALRKAVERARETLRACLTSPLSVQQIRKAAETWRIAAARREAAAVAVEARALRDVVIDGEPLAAGSSRTWRLDRTREIAVAGVLDLVITPGDGLLGKLADAERDAAAALDRLLAENGVASVEEVEERLERSRKAQEGLSSLEARLSQAAPDGVDALLQESRDASAALALLDGPGAVLALPLSVNDGAQIDRDAAERAHAMARDVLMTVRARRDVWTSRSSAAREACAVNQAKLDALATALAGVDRRLAALPPADQMKAACEAARKEWAEQRDLLDALRARWQAEGGAGAAEDAERSRKAFEGIEREHGDLLRQIADLRAKLEVHGGERLHEDVLDATAAAEAARADLERVERRALAARRLKEALDAARQQAQERLLAPVRARVEPYLSEMFPGSALDLDEAWSVRGLRTGDTPEAFDLLSGGAREQLSVIVRLGLAEVLGDGQRLPVVLDDALVNSDPVRLARMLRVLYRAASRLQVLVFSCHEVAFDGLGATRVFRMPSVRGLRGAPLPAPAPSP